MRLIWSDVYAQPPEETPPTDQERIEALEKKVAELIRKLEGIIENHKLWDGS